MLTLGPRQLTDKMCTKTHLIHPKCGHLICTREQACAKACGEFATEDQVTNDFICNVRTCPYYCSKGDEPPKANGNRKSNHR